MERKRRPFAALSVGLVVVVILGVASYPFWRSKNDPRMISGLQPLMKFMPRSAFMTKPWINIPWLGGKRLQYPPLSAMPKGFVDDPQVSGIVFWEDPKPAAGSPPVPSFPGGLAAIGSTFFNSALWQDRDGNKMELSAGNTLLLGLSGPTVKQYSPLPYVYGDEPRTFKVHWIDYGAIFRPMPAGPPPILKAEIELPPNHQPPPVLSPKEVQVGKTTLIFSPFPRIGPGFSAKYRVEVKGQAKDDVYFMETVASNNKPGFVATNLLLTKDEPTFYTERMEKTTATIIVRKVRREEFEITARLKKGTTSSMRQFDLINAQGRKVAIAYDYGGGGAVLPRAGDSGLLDIQVVGFGQQTLEHTHGQPQLDMLINTGVKLTPATLKDGQKLRAVGYRPLNMETGKLRLL